MNEPALAAQNAGAGQAGDPGQMTERESGLHRGLKKGQLAMIGLGSAIGTGLFLGSAIAVKAAGPAVLVSFAVAALIAMTMIWGLAEMAAAHPAAGTFGLYAEMYLHEWAGFAVRLTYWLCVVMAVGSEVVASAIYCHLWMPGVPSWAWIAAFSGAILYVNTMSVGQFGASEFWLSMVKVVTILVFIVLGAALLLGVGFPRIGFANYTEHGGFLPNGCSGVGLGVVMGVFSFFGVETVGSTAGEAADPKASVPRALRRTLLALTIFYLAALTVVVGIVPWPQIGLGESPFVRVFEQVGIRGAGHVMNFVVLSAALSSAMANLYFAARLLFSLARGGYAPKAFGRLSPKGMPVAAVLASAAGMAAALVLSGVFKDSLFVYMVGLSTFGGLLAWSMVLLTHLSFRRFHERRGRAYLRLSPRGPWASLAGLGSLIAVLISTWWVPGFRVTLVAGVPWLLFVTVCYVVWKKVRMRSARAATSAPAE